MRTSEKADAKEESGKRTAYLEQDWMTKVLSDGSPNFAKLVFIRIASFGERGCWMTNETLQERLGMSQSMISRAITSLWKKGDLIITGWDGHGRRMYAKGYPGVKEKLNRECNEALGKGKIKSEEEYLAKIRLRVKSEKREN